jgi:hypothetical protein
LVAKEEESFRLYCSLVPWQSWKYYTAGGVLYTCTVWE